MQSEIHFRLSDFWIGLTEVTTRDPCFMVWSGDCKRPRWTSFPDNSYLDITLQKCVALTETLKFKKTFCNQTLPFVCEKKAGTCETSLEYTLAGGSSHASMC